MLAELFMLRLEALRRRATPSALATSDTRFVPIRLPDEGLGYGNCRAPAGEPDDATTH